MTAFVKITQSAALFVWLVSIAPPLQGQERVVTLPEAIRLAQRVQPTVVQARGALAVAGSDVRSAYSAFLPSLSGSAGAGQSFFPQAQSRLDPQTGELISGTNSNKSVNFGVNSSLILFDGFRREANIRSAKADRDASEASLINQEAQVALATSLEFFNALSSQQLVLAREAGIQRADEQFKIAVAKLRTGAATVSDSLRAVVTLNEARLQKLDAERQLATAEASLARLIGEPGRVSAVDDPSLYDTDLELDADALLDEAVDRSPRVRASDASVRAARAGVTVAKSGYWPTLSLSANTQLSGSQLDDYDLQRTSNINLGLNWNLFDRFSRERQVDQSAVLLDNAAATLADDRRLVAANLTSQLAALNTARVRIDVTKLSLEAAQADLRVQLERYRLGSITIVEVLTSQESLTRAEEAEVSARIDFLRAKAQIEAIIGRSLS
ncbi:MAG: TolC family protein [Gemmatimonadales bacterium]|nr:TolC family protein [Gemmatimonadales bacterium]